MKQLFTAFLLLSSMNAMAASATGVCVGFKKTSDTEVSKTFIHNITKTDCEALRSAYDDLQFKEGSIHILGNCKDYSCSFPCIDHLGCTCATGSCY